MKKIVLFYVVLVSFCFGNLMDKTQQAYNKGDYKKAAELSKKSCDSGNYYSCSILGYLFENAKGVKQDYEKAKELYEMACNLKEEVGCFYLGNLYQFGKGVEQDYEKASEYYRKTCDLGEEKGCTMYKMVEFTILTKSTSKFSKFILFLKPF